MHYFSLLMIRLYTLLTVLPNHFPSWFHRGLNLVRVPYNMDSWAKFDGTTMRQLYNNSSGSQIAKFYIYFSKYLHETRPMYTIITHIGGHIAEFMYDVANDLEKIYIHLFSMFGFITQKGELQRWYKYVQYLGWAVFFLLLVIYGVGMIFNMHGGFARMKDLITGMLIATSVIFILPWLTNMFSTGLQKTADSVLGSPRSAKTSNKIITGNRDDRHGESLADSIVRNNVVSIPSVTTYAAMRGIGNIDISQHPNIFQPTHQRFSSKIPSQPYFINLYHMTDNSDKPQDISSQKDVWNGIGSGSVGQFLGNLGGDGSYLDKATLKHNTDFIRKNISVPTFDGGMNIWANKTMGGMTKGLMDIPAFFGSSTAKKIKREAQGKIDTTKYQNDVATRVYAPYKYHIKGNGNDAEFTKFNQFNGSSSFMTGLRASYGNYKVNWFNIFLGLFTIICMMIGLIIKLSNGFYKMLIMYVTSGWFLMKNATHHDKIKDFIRAFFGIFENLILDLLVLRLFVIAFVYINSFVSEETVVPLSPLAIGLVQAALSYGLFKVESQGINTLSSQLSGQGNQTGGHGLGAAGVLAAGNLGGHMLGHTADRVTHLGASGIHKGARAAGHYGKGAIGGWQNAKSRMHGGKPAKKQKGKLHQALDNATGRDDNNSTPSGNNKFTNGRTGNNGNVKVPAGKAGTAGAFTGFLGRNFAAKMRHHSDPNYQGYSLNRHGGNAFSHGHVNGKLPHYMGRPTNTKPKKDNPRAEALHSTQLHNMRKHNLSRGSIGNQLKHFIKPNPTMPGRSLNHKNNVHPYGNYTQLEGFDHKHNNSPSSTESGNTNSDNPIPDKKKDHKKDNPVAKKSRTGKDHFKPTNKPTNDAKKHNTRGKHSYNGNNYSKPKGKHSYNNHGNGHYSKPKGKHFYKGNSYYSKPKGKHFSSSNPHNSHQDNHSNGHSKDNSDNGNDNNNHQNHDSSSDKDNGYNNYQLSHPWKITTDDKKNGHSSPHLFKQGHNSRDDTHNNHKK